MFDHLAIKGPLPAPANDNRLPWAVCALIWLALGCIAWGGLFLLGEMVGSL